MATGLEALGVASAVLQVISFASDLAIACKKAYDGVKTPQDDIHRHAKQMSDAVSRVQTRCENMAKSNSKFSAPELQSIAKECKDAAERLEKEVESVTKLQAKGDIFKAIRKTLRASSHQKKLQSLEETLSKYQQLMEIELTSHLCSRSDAISLQQKAEFRKLEVDVQTLIIQLAEGETKMTNLIKQEHTATRNAIIQETVSTKETVNTHTTTQLLELTTAAEMKTQCESFLKSLKSPSMNRRYNDVMDSRDATFRRVFASYGNMPIIHNHSESHEDPEIIDEPQDNVNTDEPGSLDTMSHSDAMSDTDEVDKEWASFITWLQSDDKLFYVQGKPGSGKSTLIKFILDHDQTENLVQHWNPNAIIIAHFFWKIGSQDQNSIKGLWCSLLYQRLQGEPDLIRNTLQHFKRLSLHTSYHDWSIQDLETIWQYVATLDTRYLCILVDGLDEIRNEDGFSQLTQSIQLISGIPNTKLCVSTRPEAQIMRWIKATNASGIRLEDLTRLDMFSFVRKRFHRVLPNEVIPSKACDKLTWILVERAQGVFLWLHLSTRSILEGAENYDSEDMLFARLWELPEDLEKLYADMWQRLNSVYREIAARYFRYAMQRSSMGYTSQNPDTSSWVHVESPLIFQIACAEDPKIHQAFLSSPGTIDEKKIQQMCDSTKASIHIRCAGLLEVRPQDRQYAPQFFSDKSCTLYDAVSYVEFIHRTAHDFLTDTEVGQSILGCASLTDFASQTRLLKGLIVQVVVFQVKWGLVVNSGIIDEIIRYSERWKSEGLEVAIEMLDIIRPLYEKKFMRRFVYTWKLHPPIFNLLSSHEQFDAFVISRLTAENSASLATSVLCDGWDDAGRSKRLFDVLLALGADPHDYRVSLVEMTPFTLKVTAFWNLLLTFLEATQELAGISKAYYRPFVKNDKLNDETSCHILEMVIRMAKTCENLSTSVVILGSFTEAGSMSILPFHKLAYIGDRPDLSGKDHVIYEVNLQFLLLYIISKVRMDIVEGLGLGLEAQELLSRITSPTVKIRVFVPPEPTEDLTERDSESDNGSYTETPLMCQRFPSNSSSLTTSDMESLFRVELKGCTRESRTPRQSQSGLHIVSQHIQHLDAEEVDFESALTSLAGEGLGLCTCEEAGKAPDIGFLRSYDMRIQRRLFPLLMGRLEAAAADNVQGKCHERVSE